MEASVHFALFTRGSKELAVTRQIRTKSSAGFLAGCRADFQVRANEAAKLPHRRLLDRLKPPLPCHPEAGPKDLRLFFVFSALVVIRPLRTLTALSS